MEQGRKQWLWKGGVVGYALMYQHHDGMAFLQRKVADLCFVRGDEGRHEYSTLPYVLYAVVHVGTTFFRSEMPTYMYTLAFETEQHDVAYGVVCVPCDV